MTEFNVKQDIEIEKAGGFWCEACLTGKPAAEQSPDPRYCHGCYEFLKAEAKLLPRTKRPVWIPKAEKDETATENLYRIPGHGRAIMSTVNGQKTEVDIIEPAVATRPSPKRGPKFTELPEGLIKQLAGEGMGSKAIVARLKETGFDVSYKTVQRRLQEALI